MHKKRRQFLSQNIIGVSVSNLRFYFFSLRYLFTRRLLNSAPKPLADYKAIHKIQTTTVVRIYANTVVTFFEILLLRFPSSLGSHPAGPFLYRSYIVLISFLYKNIRTI